MLRFIASNKVFLASGTAFVFGLSIWVNHRLKNYADSLDKLKSLLEQRLCYKRSKVIVTIIESEDDWRHMGMVFVEKARRLQLLGLDLEWVDNKKSALMQLALPDGSCILIRLSLLKSIPIELQDLLKNSVIIKLGVGIKQDSDKLCNDYGIICNSWVDIRYIIHSKYPNLKCLGMASIAKNVLNINLDKDMTIRRSNWEDGDFNGQLSHRQVEYAANDALIAVNAILSVTIDNIEVINPLLKPFHKNTYEALVKLSKYLCLSYKELDFDYKILKKKEKCAQRNVSKPRKSSPELELRGAVLICCHNCLIHYTCS